MEGKADFYVPGVSAPCQTWYKVVGDLNSPGSTPLIILHGGPGASHDYLLPLTDLAPTIPLIFYDQIGGGRSTHLPDRAGDEAFWTVDLFVRELDNLLEHLNLRNRPVDVYGHSWGGVVVTAWASTPSSAANLRRLVISNISASMDLHRAGFAKLRKRLPEDVQAALDRGEAENNFTSPEYQAAFEVFSKRHLSLSRPWPPQEVRDLMRWYTEGLDVYTTIFGPNTLLPVGTIRDWTAIPSLPKIKVPTLMIDGAEDTPSEAMQPFFDLIEKAKWITLDNAAHMSHVDQREKYMKQLRGFLTA
ncbi:proline-specific peptidase [Hypoxylon cercidicola]|nr:proline-specific peptidase [Hypoxylon cercidicola]